MSADMVKTCVNCGHLSASATCGSCGALVPGIPINIHDLGSGGTSIALGWFDELVVILDDIAKVLGVTVKRNAEGYRTLVAEVERLRASKKKARQLRADDLVTTVRMTKAASEAIVTRDRALTERDALLKDLAAAETEVARLRAEAIPKEYTPCTCPACRRTAHEQERKKP